MPRSSLSNVYATLRRALLVVLLAMVLPLTACDDNAAGPAGGGAAAGPPASYPYKVTTTIAMVTDIVRQVAGDKAEVTGIMKEGIDPHVYQPTRADRNLLADADVIFYNGLNLEGKMGDVLVKMARDGKPVFAVTELLDDGQYVMSDEQEHFDPHVWMDVQGWMKAVSAVAESLGGYDPANAGHYKANADAYLSKLKGLDDYARRVIGSIPQEQRVLVTAHDAFNYMGRAYGLEVMGIQGISTDSEPSINQVNDLVATITQRKIPAVFFESSVPEKQVRSLVEGCAANGHEVKVGGTLYSDAMGAAGTYEGTYIGMIDHNVSTIARALGGNVPEGGFRAEAGGE